MSKKNLNYYYFVEGECEKVLINSLKNKYLESGKIKILNMVTKEIPLSIMRILTNNTICILIFDIDVLKDKRQKIDRNIIKQNIQKLRSYSAIKEVIVVCQTDNLEDELIYSTKLNKIQEMFKVNSIREHKTKFVDCKNLNSFLERYEFDILKFWSRNNLDFLPLNRSKEIKIIKKLKK